MQANWERLRYVKRGVGVLVVVLVGTLGLPSCSLAAGPPRLSLIDQIIHSTRVLMAVELSSEGLATKWRSEYVQAEECASASEWLPVSEGEAEAEPLTSTLQLGGADPGEGANAPFQLRHLAPETHYCVRFVAENVDGAVNDEIPVTTDPVGKPEVPILGVMENEQGNPPIFRASEITNTSFRVSAKIESNG